MAEAKGPALRQVLVDLAIAAIVKAENIEVNDEEVEAEYSKLAEMYGMDVEPVKKYVTVGQIKDQLCTKKAVDVVADSAFEDTLMEMVADNLTVEVPDAMVETQARQFIDNFKMQIAQSGIPYARQRRGEDDG